MTYYVYTDYKPCGEPFYVGKGNIERVKQKERNRFHQSICDKYPGWYREIVLEETEPSCFAEEKRLIALYGRRDLGVGTLVNLTDGGEGVSGHIHSEETRAKIADVQKGRVRSAETKDKLSVAAKGKPKSDEHRANMSLGQRLRAPASEETRAKQSLVQTGKVRCDESRDRMSAAAKNISAETRAKMADANRSEETRAKKSASAKLRWAKKHLEVSSDGSTMHNQKIEINTN